MLGEAEPSDTQLRITCPAHLVSCARLCSLQTQTCYFQTLRAHARSTDHFVCWWLMEYEAERLGTVRGIGEGPPCTS